MIVEFHFVSGFKYWRLRAHKRDEALARAILAAIGAEFVAPSARPTWRDVDSQSLLSFLAVALPKLIARGLPTPETIINTAIAIDRPLSAE